MSKTCEASWRPCEDEGGFKADFGLVELVVLPSNEDDTYIAACRWWGDEESEPPCESAEAAKEAAKRLAIAHLRATIEEIEKL